MVTLDQEFSPSFRGCIGIGGFQDVFFLHGLGFKGLALTVYFICGNVNKSSHATVTLGRFEENMRPKDITLREIEGVSEAIIDVSLGGKVHHRVDLFLRHDVGDEIGRGNVSFDEFEVFEASNVLEVGETGTVVEFIVDYHVIVGILLGEEDGHVRADEACKC